MLLHQELRVQMQKSLTTESFREYQGRDRLLSVLEQREGGKKGDREGERKSIQYKEKKGTSMGRRAQVEEEEYREVEDRSRRTQTRERQERERQIEGGIE